MKATNPDISLEMCNLSTESIFRFLDKNDWQALAKNHKCFDYKKGDCIIHQGHRMGGFFCISKGIVKLSNSGDAGKEQIIKLLKAGDILGYQYAMNEKIPEISAFALTDSKLYFIPSEVLFFLIKNNQRFAVEILKTACHEQEEMINQITFMAQKTVKERLAQKLVHIEQCFGNDTQGFMNLTLSREEYANFIGTATETIIRLLADFKKNGWIEIKKRKIKITDPKQLLTISNSIE